jgi:uncharacterized protein
MKIKIRGHDFILSPRRTIYWPHRKTLLAADLHWGKDIVFHQYGIPVPHGTLQSDLARLDEDLLATKAERLLVLGDLVHSHRAVTDELATEIANWRAKHTSLTVEIIQGNHDRRLNIPDNWRFQFDAHEIEEDGFVFTHDKYESEKLFVFSGHMHPMIRISSGPDHLRLPCFVLGQKNLTLPAFSLFTGGQDLLPRPGETIFVLAENKIVPFNWEKPHLTL